MLIPPPIGEPEKTVEEEIAAEEYERVRQYINCPNWKCPVCKGVMMGRVLNCVYCKFRGVITPRPSSYGENDYERTHKR